MTLFRAFAFFHIQHQPATEHTELATPKKYSKVFDRIKTSVFSIQDWQETSNGIENKRTS
jgi:hypothetical protein